MIDMQDSSPLDLSSLDGPVTFIGGGNMATAMIEGIETLDDAPAVQVIDLSTEVLDRHEDQGREVTDDLAEGLGRTSVVFLAVKPQHLADLRESLAAAIRPGTLLISVLAGTPCAALEAFLPETVRVARVMPNTPMAVGEGMAAVAAGTRATDGDVELAAALCRPSAEVLIVPESRMDAITAVSGSGPAYFFRFCEVLMNAARDELDFSEAEARLLVCQTAKGACEYLAATEGFPAGKLRRQVTSKGGTTAAALSVFDEGGLDQLARDALNAAVDRAAELAALTGGSGLEPATPRPRAKAMAGASPSADRQANAGR